MNGKRMLRSFATVLAAAVIVGLVGVPAQAAAPSGTGSITVGRDILAGTTDFGFQLQVNNTDPPVVGNTVNFVSVLVPSGMTLVDGTAQGWTRDVRGTSNRVLFSGGSIAPGGSTAFTVFADVSRPAADAAKRWSISISSDGGTTASSITPSDTAGNALTSNIRVLKVLSVKLISPTAVLDNTVTENQSNAVAQEVVQNAGSAALTVHPTLSVQNGSTSQQTPDTAIASTGGTQAFNFGVTFGTKAAAATVALAGGASSTGATAMGASSDPIQIQSGVTLSYNSGSLTPQFAIPGHAYGFALGVTKGGDVDLTSVNLTNTKLTFASGAFSASLASPSSLASGSNQLQFASTTVPTSISDGGYSPSLTVVGTDSNGAPVAVSPTVGDKISLDSTAPVATPSISVPASKVNGENAAASNGKTINFGGTINDNGTSCGSCVLTGSFLQEYTGGTASGTIPVTLTNSSGTISGSYGANYDAGVTAIALVTTVADLAGNSIQASSPLVDVDNVAPFISTDGALTHTGGPNHSDNTRIDVAFSEPVATNAPMSAADWHCDGHNIIQAAQNSSKTPANSNFTSVTLTVNPAIAPDEQPSCQYKPQDANRAQDRVGFSIANTTFAVADGILPPAPNVDSVAGLSPAGDGKFYTNQSSPTFSISNTNAGNTVTLYRDNGDGTFNASDASIGSAQVPSGTTVSIQSASLGTANGPVLIFVQGVDGAGNKGNVGTVNLVLDFVPPALSSFSQNGTTITLTFSEPLRFGRNAAADFVVYHRNADGTFDGFQLGSVAGSGATRTLTINDSSFATGTSIDRVQYDYAGPIGSRYQDNAGNDLVNFTVTQ